MSHNKRVTALLESLEPLIDSAEKEDHFIPVFDKLHEFVENTGEIKYNHGNNYLISITFFLTSALYAWAHFAGYQLQDWLGIYEMPLFCFLVLMAIIPLFVISGKNGKISELSDFIFEKDILFDNGLSFIDVSKCGSSLFDKYAGSFGDFRGRGDENKKIESLLAGDYSGKEAKFSYSYYKFHYVEVYYVPVPVTVGKTTIMTMQRRTRDCYRYGLNTEFKHRTEFAIVSSGGNFEYPCEWSSESQIFNSQFSVYAKDELTVARFLTPAVILAFEEICEYFSNLNLEVNSEGQMNISFVDNDIINCQRKSSIVNPIEFRAEIESFLEVPKLNKLLCFLESLHQFNDENF